MIRVQIWRLIVRSSKAPTWSMGVYITGSSMTILDLPFQLLTPRRHWRPAEPPNKCETPVFLLLEQNPESTSLVLWVKVHPSSTPCPSSATFANRPHPTSTRRSCVPVAARSASNFYPTLLRGGHLDATHLSERSIVGYDLIQTSQGTQAKTPVDQLD